MKRFVVLLGILFILIGCGETAAPTQETEPRFDPAVLAVGEEVYTANCASCHGVDLKGGVVNNMLVPSHLDDGHTWHHPDSYLVDVVTNGGTIPGQMPAYRDTLTEDEIIAVLDYIKNHWSDRIYEMQQMRNN